MKFDWKCVQGFHWKSVLVQVMAWCQRGAKPFPSPVMSKFCETQLYLLHLPSMKYICTVSQIARFTGGQTWGPSGANRTQVGPMLAPWTLLSGVSFYSSCWNSFEVRRSGKPVDFVLQATDLQMSFMDLSKTVGYQRRSSNIGHQVTCPTDHSSLLIHDNLFIWLTIYIPQ